MSEKAKIIASRGIYRLVHETRDAKSWPNISDLTMERLETDALGEGRWTFVTSWCLSECSDQDLRHSAAYQSVAALKMLLDPGPIEKA